VTDETTTASVEDALLSALATIRDQWAVLLPDAPGAIRPTRSTPRRLYTLPDESESGSDLPRLDVCVDLRREVTLALNGWARVVMEDRPVTRALPNGADTLGLVEFLERHARWLSGHEAASDATSELGDWAAKVHAAAEPRKREKAAIGDCPFILDFGDDIDLRVDSDDSPMMCHGRVWATVGPDSFAECDECGTWGPVEWWEEVLDVLPDHGVTPAEMVDILHRRIGYTVTERTLRNWERAGRVQRWLAFGPQLEKPPLRLLPKAVLAAVTRMWRECPGCGKEWSGIGEVCSECQWSMRAAPSIAEPKAAYAVVPVGTRPTLVTPPVLVGPWHAVCWHQSCARARETQPQPTRCEWSDLPLSQCACGRHAQPA
jgi:hypothetical protein